MPSPRSPWRIAIADDSPAFLAAAARYIETLPGYVLAGTAPSALEAPALVQAVMPDLLLLDLGIAPSRGLEVVRRLKAVPGAPAIVALALFYSQEAAAHAELALTGKAMNFESLERLYQAARRLQAALPREE